MGCKFALPITTDNFKAIPLIADIEQWVQSIKDDTEKNIVRSKIAGRISNYKRYISHSEREKFIIGVYEETKRLIKQHEEHIIITTADKGNKTVIMYKENYNKKMEELLEDKSTYRKCREDPTPKLEKTNNKLVNELYKKEYITLWDKTRLTSIAATSPTLYGLPKIHKDNIPLRPISSSQKVPCYNLSQHIGKILKNIISTEHNIKNSTQLKKDLDEVSLDTDDIIVSFDVVSLFTNIPTHLAIKNIMDKWSEIQTHTKIPRKTFLQLLKFCIMDNNYFKFNNDIYNQTYGMPMGNPLSPTIADIVLDTLLDDVIKDLEGKNVRIKVLKKYVDDIFAIINKNDETVIMKTLNTYHQKLKFTIEKEINGEIPYLDMKIIKNGEKLTTNWYTKSTASGRILNYNSTQPTSMKINTATNLIKTVHNISDQKYRDNNINKIREILLKNNYPSGIINKLLDKHYKDTDVQQISSTNNEKNFISVPYIPRMTENKILKSIIDDNNTTIAYKSNETLRRIFSRQTTKTDKLQQNDVVYEITCKGTEAEECNKVYVGTTKRKLDTRLREHEADINKGRESTGLAQHVKEHKHTVDLKNVRILDKEKMTNKRYTLESLRIQERLHKSLNTKEDKDGSNLQYSVVIF